MFARGGAAPAVSDAAWLQAMLDAEAALARACAGEGLLPSAAAEQIAGVCRADRYDVGEIGRRAAASANPVVPLVPAIRALLAPDVAPYVHLGATSQDILDTAAMLVARRALGPVLEDAGAAAEAAAVLTERHADAVGIGRTLLQQALPVPFALKAAGWMTALDEAAAALAALRATGLAAQLGGAVGTLAAYDGRGAQVLAAFAADLELAEPVLPWHTDRVRPATVAGALGVLTGVFGKIAQDVVLLAQDEVGEVREGGGPGRGGSSAMAHKRNPVAAVTVLACAHRTPALVATMQGAMVQEHERAAGAWQAEWETLSDLLRLAGSAAAWGRELLEELEVDEGRLEANLRAALARTGDAGDADRHRQASAPFVQRALAAHRGQG